MSSEIDSRWGWRVCWPFSLNDNQDSDKKDEKKQVPWGPIAVAFFGAIGVIAAAYFGYLQVKVTQDVELANIQADQEQITSVVTENQDVADSTTTDEQDTTYDQAGAEGAKEATTKATSERSAVIRSRDKILIGIRRTDMVPLAARQGNDFRSFGQTAGRY